MTDYLALAKRMDDMYHLDQPPEEFYAAADAIRAQAARIMALEVALKPFADDVKSFEGFSDAWEIDPLSNLTVGDLRAARAAYSGEKND